MAQGKRDEAEALKKQVTADSERLAELEAKEAELDEKIKKDHDDNSKHYRSKRTYR